MHAVNCRHLNVPHAVMRLSRYTVGGFYLARYSESPVGAFDEVRKSTPIPFSC